MYKHVKNSHSTKSEKQTQDEIIIHQLSPSQIGEIDEDLIQNVVINIDNKIVENISIEEKGLSVALSWTVYELNLLHAQNESLSFLIEECFLSAQISEKNVQKEIDRNWRDTTNF